MLGNTQQPRPRIHLVGIGGVGMSALAQALLDAGAALSGSDRLLDHGDLTDTLETLQRQGVKLAPQDGSALSPEVDRLIVSSAIEEDNPDLLAARRYKIGQVHRATELARLVADRKLLAISGTSGKSSVTAMVGWLLAECGLDPLVINGAAICGWDAAGRRIGSVRHGCGEYAVIEADESDRSLLCFRPRHAIITNCTADHFDLSTTKELFTAFRSLVAGTTIESQPAATDLLPASGWQGGFNYLGHTFTLPLPGRHNCHNAWQAVALCHTLGVPLPQLAAALARFPGVARRLERVGTTAHGAIVIDDYAHNPAKLTAAWQTTAAVFPRVVGLWRPHGYAPLRNNLAGLAAAFATIVRPSDRLLILPVYDAGGSATRDVNAGDLAARLSACGLPVELPDDIPAAAAMLRRYDAPDTALLLCGARDPDLPRLARQLVATESGQL